MAGWKLIGKDLTKSGGCSEFGRAEGSPSIPLPHPAPNSCWFGWLFPQVTLGQNICDDASKKLSFRKK